MTTAVLAPARRAVLRRRVQLQVAATITYNFFSFDPRPSGGGELEVQVPESRTAVLNAMHQRAEAARKGGVRW